MQLQREYERKQRAGGFVELSNINEIAAEKAASSRREMREKMRKQKREIEEAKSKQPSLIERYEQVGRMIQFCMDYDHVADIRFSRLIFL